MIPKKSALGLDHRKSDVSDLRPSKVPELGNTRVLVVAPGFRRRSCSIKKLERGDDSKRSHHALDQRATARRLPAKRSRAASADIGSPDTKPCAYSQPS